MTLTAEAAAPTSLCVAPVATTGSHCVGRVPRLVRVASPLGRSKWRGNPPSPIGDATRTGDARGLANATLTAVPHGGNATHWLLCASVVRYSVTFA
ncbi:hypothetical protein [Nostoc sp.]|uniref:hypothetical protein n=1 Tax=Nostoc sp. TaxID=1180 RepID=UPI002FF4D42F